MPIKCTRPLFALLLASSICLPLPVLAQGLPPTNMGKFVHQPGDNQYQPGSQVARHGSGGYLDNTGCEDHRAEVQRAHQQAVMPSYTLAPPPPPGPDVSIEPIAAEEPIPAPGFPPLPLSLDLPVQMGVQSISGRGKWSDGGGGGSGGGGGRGPGGPTGMHEHYAHYDAGAFAPKKNNTGMQGGGSGGGGGGGDDYAGGGAPSGGGGEDFIGNGGGGGSNDAPPPKVRTVTAPAVSNTAPTPEVVRSGYRVRTPAPIMRTDRFDTTTANNTTGRGAQAAGTPGGGPRNGKDKAPGLDDSQDAVAGGAPDAPTATGVFQTQSEDLTLPDDEFTSRNFKNGKKNRYAKQMMKRGKQLGRQMLRQTGVPIGF